MANQIPDALYDEVELSAIFNSFCYLNDVSPDNRVKFGDFFRSLSEETYGSQGEYQVIAQALECGKYKDLADFTIENASREGGTEAYVFVSPDRQTSVVAFRGTGDGEWIDNGQGMGRESTQQQERAAAYFDKMAKQYGWTESDNVIVTGHSKGGNKVQYVTLAAEHKNLIDHCYSMDGQGFSGEAIEKFKKMDADGYQESLDKMYSICGENDYVNPLGKKIISEDHTVYLETPVDQMDLGGYHAICNFFYRDGSYSPELNPGTERGRFSFLSQDISTGMMLLPRKERESCAVTIMQFLEAWEGSSVGIDGSVMTLEQFGDFIDRGIPTILYALLFSVAGRYLLEKIEWDLTKLILPNGMQFPDNIVDWFLQEKEVSRGDRHSYFHVELGALEQTEDQLRQVVSQMNEIEERIRTIKSQIAFGLLTKEGLNIALGVQARKIAQQNEKVEKMAAAIEQIREIYLANEKQIAAAMEQE